MENPSCDLLNALWRSSEQIHFFGTLDRTSQQFRNIPVEGLDSATAQAAERSAQGEEIYFACAEYANADSRTQANATGAFGFWADIDCGEQKAAEGKGYADVTQALAALDAFCSETGLPEPSFKVNSGSGLHAYWIVNALVPKDQWQACARKLKAVAAKAGFLADPARTADIASVMRIPGTLNRKYVPPKPVSVLHARQNFIASSAMFDAIDSAHVRYCQDVAATPKPAGSGAVDRPEVPASTSAHTYGPPDLAQVASALSVLDPDCDDFTWKFHRIAPLARAAMDHPALAEDLKALGMKWSSGELRGSPSTAWTNPGATTALTGKQAYAGVWARFSNAAYDGQKTTLGTVYKDAAAEGWRYPPSDVFHVTTAATSKESLARAVDAPKEDEPQIEAETEAQVVKRLASLKATDYDRRRKEEAKAMGVQVKTLDGLVKAARAEEGAAVNSPFQDPEPAEEPVDPAALLTEISTVIREFVILEPEQADAAALWVAHTHLTDVAETSPIAIINAPERACAKTLFQTVLGRMAHRPLPASNASLSALFRAIESWQPTLFIDEADTFFRDNTELHGMVNAGYKRGGYVLRSEATGDSFEPRMFSVYGAKSIAGIALERHLPDSTMSRGLVINLRRKLPGETVQRLRHADGSLFDRLASQLARFATDYSQQIRLARPDLPAELSDRAQDNWEPLLAIAECAGPDWVQRATVAALKLSVASEATSSTGNDLLADIKAALEQWPKPSIRTADLIEKLVADEELGWSTYNRGKPLTPRQLAKRLGVYGIRPKTVRQPKTALDPAGSTPKGYELADFKDAFERYLKPDSGKPEAALLPNEKDVVAGPEKVADTPQQQAVGKLDPDCGGVADTADDAPESPFKSAAF